MPLVRTRTIAIAIAAALVAAACGADTASAPDGISPIDGFDVEVVLTDLAQPTQFYIEDTEPRSIVIAEINGGENDATGQVSRIELPPDGESQSVTRTVLFDRLDKPTGVALFDDQIWVMQTRTLTRGPTVGGKLEVEAFDLPNNGRSQGTLTATDSNLLFDVSGRKRGSGDDTVVTQGSGRLFEVGTINDIGYEISEIASGFKHAYAHLIDESGTLWATEMTDGLFDGQPGTDEIVAVSRRADHGWPHCVDDNRPVAEFGGSPERCADVPRSLTTLGVGATPTSVVVSPWNPDELVVALWKTGEVVAVRTDTPQAQPRVLIRGLSNPQHLVVDDDRLMLSEFGTGRLLLVMKH